MTTKRVNYVGLSVKTCVIVQQVSSSSCSQSVPVKRLVSALYSSPQCQWQSDSPLDAAVLQGRARVHSADRYWQLHCRGTCTACSRSIVPCWPPYRAAVACNEWPAGPHACIECTHTHTTSRHTCTHAIYYRQYSTYHLKIIVANGYAEALAGLPDQILLDLNTQCICAGALASIGRYR